MIETFYFLQCWMFLRMISNTDIYRYTDCIRTAFSLLQLLPTQLLFQLTHPFPFIKSVHQIVNESGRCLSVRYHHSANIPQRKSNCLCLGIFNRVTWTTVAASVCRFVTQIFLVCGDATFCLFSYQFGCITDTLQKPSNLQEQKTTTKLKISATKSVLWPQSFIRKI